LRSVVINMSRWKMRASSAVGCLQERHAASEAASMGSTVLDWAESDVDGLEIRSGHRSTRDGDLMATAAIQT